MSEETRMENELQMIQTQSSNRHAYLVRLWREGDHAPWRIMVQEVGTDCQQKFADWQAFEMYLHALRDS